MTNEKLNIISTLANNVTGGLLTIIGVAIGHKMTIRTSIKDKKRKLVSELGGLVVLRGQLYFSHVDCELNNDFGLGIIKLFRNHPSEQGRLDAMQLRINKAGDLRIEIAKINQKLLEILTELSIYFNDDKEVIKLIDKCRNFRNPKIPEPSDCKSLEELTALKATNKKSLYHEIEVWINKDLQKLIDLLLKKMK